MEEICLYKVDEILFIKRLKPFFKSMIMYFLVVTFVIILMYLTDYTKKIRWDAYVFFLIVTVIRGIGSVRVAKKYLYKVCCKDDILILKYVNYDISEELKIPLKYCSMNIVAINTIIDVYELKFFANNKLVFRQQNISNWEKLKMKEVLENVEKRKRYMRTNGLDSNKLK